jgi:CRP/FNR family cyclic AMP-dependent transcriptional regulator
MSTTSQNTNTTPDESSVSASTKASISTGGQAEMPRKTKASPCVIGESNLGTELDEVESQVLAEIMDVRTLHKDEVLVTEGAADNSLFVLASGRLAVAHGGGGKRETPVYVMSPGECAGTRAFVDRTGRKATLRAQGDVTVYALQPEPFEALLQTHPLLVYKVMRALFRITHGNLMRMNMESRELTNYIPRSRGRY